MQRKSTAWWLLFAGLTLSRGALAQHDPADASRLKVAADEYDAGRRAFKLGEFESAATHFENADRDAPSAEALMGAIRSWQEAHQMARAATLAALGLTRHPNDKQMADLAHQVIAAASPSFHKIIVSCSPACALAVDNKLTPYREGTSAILFVEPGPHTVEAGWSGKRRAAKELTAVAGGQTQLAMAPPPEKKEAEPLANPPVENETQPETVEPVAGSGEAETGLKRKGLPPAVFIAGIGATAVLAGVTIWSGIDTQNNPGPGRVQRECVDTSCDLYQEGLSKQRRTNVLLAVTGVAGVATAVIGVFFTDFGGGADKNKAVVTPVVVVGDGLMVGAAGRFR